MPDQLTQYIDATTNLAVFDLGTRAQIELRGSDRLSFLHNFCTNDIKKLRPGEGCEAFLTNIKGRIIGHIIVSATDDSLWIDSVPGSKEFIASHLDKYLITEDVTINDHTGENTLCLIGPHALGWLSNQSCETNRLPMWGQLSVKLFEREVIIRRVGFTLPDAYEIISVDSRFVVFWDGSIDAGATPGSKEVFDALRIEAGFPLYGIDITDANIAQEAGRTSQAISFNKGCYLGQEPIARLDALGHVNKQLRTLQIDGGPVPFHGSAVTLKSGEEAGHITSAVLSPSTGHPIALAMLKSNAQSPDIELTIGTASATLLPITKVT